MKEKRVLIVSGPTGVGENTIVSKICEKYSNFRRLVTATTRAPRLGEKNKIDYYFMSNERFLKEVKKGNIPEYQNSRDRDVYYGTYLPDLAEKASRGLNVIITPDITGTKYFKNNWNATTIFIMPDSMESLKKRHLKRDSSVSEDDLKKRLDYAKYEIENERNSYDFEVVNAHNKLDEAVDNIIEIVKQEGYKLED
jgi:guanylate kinase